VAGKDNLLLESFDRTALRLKPLSARKHDLDASIVKPLDRDGYVRSDDKLRTVASRILDAKTRGAAVIMMMGGHVIRSGVQRYLIDLMERKYISCVAMNGAGMIHDFEFALVGATTESVATYVREGQFGLWQETGQINEYVNQAYRAGLGMGEGVGWAIVRRRLPRKDISILAAGVRCRVPVTVHVGIGSDILHEHPNCSGAATGETSYRDFLHFASVVERLEGGVVMDFGSAVMAPEVFLKALSMARNKAHQGGRSIRHFTSLVCDLYPLENSRGTEISKDDPAYYFRPWKTLLVRTVADGGESFYVQGRHAETIPCLWHWINELEASNGRRD